YARRPRPVSRGERVAFAVDPSVRRAVEALARQQVLTPFMVLLTAFGMLMGRYAGATDVLVGTPVANRFGIELEPLIGFFVNTLALGVRIRGSVLEVLAEVKQFVLEAFARQAVPFERLVDAMVRERDLSRPPLVQVMFAMQSVPGVLKSASGLELEMLDVEFGTAKFDVTLTMHEDGEGWRGVLEYDADLFKRTTIERMADHFVRLLDAMLLAPPHLAAADLSIVGEAERALIVRDWNQTNVRYPRSNTVPELFDQVVSR